MEVVIGCDICVLFVGKTLSGAIVQEAYPIERLPRMYSLFGELADVRGDSSTEDTIPDRGYHRWVQHGNDDTLGMEHSMTWYDGIELCNLFDSMLATGHLSEECDELRKIINALEDFRMKQKVKIQDAITQIGFNS